MLQGLFAFSAGFPIGQGQLKQEILRAHQVSRERKRTRPGRTHRHFAARHLGKPANGLQIYRHPAIFPRIGHAQPIDVAQLAHDRGLQRRGGIFVMFNLNAKSFRDVVIVGLGDHRILSIDLPGLKLRLGHHSARPAVIADADASDPRAVIAQVRSNGNPVNGLSPGGSEDAFQRGHVSEGARVVLAGPAQIRNTGLMVFPHRESAIARLISANS